MTTDPAFGDRDSPVAVRLPFPPPAEESRVCATAALRLI